MALVKTVNNTFVGIPHNDEELLDFLRAAFRLAKRHGKTRTQDEHRFEIFAPENLKILRDDIASRTYDPSAGVSFLTHDPVLREIVAAPFRDRIGHHLVHGLITPWWDPKLDPHAFSCRVGKGTTYGVETLHRDMQAITNSGAEEAFVIKMDIKGFFMHINRLDLLEHVIWGIRQHYTKKSEAYTRELLEFLCTSIILDNPLAGIRDAGTEAERAKLPHDKSLIYQLIGRGLVIGNLTSQDFQNIYLSPFDHFMRHELGFQYYGRYVDDAYALVKASELEWAMAVIESAVKAFLENMGLQLHPTKFSVHPVSQGCLFLGYKVYPDHILPGPRICGKLYEALEGYVLGQTSLETLRSYVSMGSHCASEQTFRRIFEHFGAEF